MFRGWFQWSKWRRCLRSVLPQSCILLCISLWAKELNVKDIHKETFPVYGEKCSSHKLVHNCVMKFSQGRLEIADGTWPGRPVETVTEASVLRVEELIRAHRRITIGSVVTTLRGSHGSAYSIMHVCLKLQKVCAWWVSRELKDREKMNWMDLA
jgi:hypothetical protein